MNITGYQKSLMNTWKPLKRSDPTLSKICNSSNEIINTIKAERPGFIFSPGNLND
jgi:hypothetical protein